MCKLYDVFARLEKYISDAIGSVRQKRTFSSELKPGLPNLIVTSPGILI